MFFVYDWVQGRLNITGVKYLILSLRIHMLRMLFQSVTKLGGLTSGGMILAFGWDETTENKYCNSILFLELFIDVILTYTTGIEIGLR